MKIEIRNTIIFTTILLLGLFFPTSLNGVIHSNFSVLGTTLAVLFVSVFLRFKLSGNNILIFFIFNFSLIAFTFASNFVERSYGIYPSFLLLSLLFFVNIKQIILHKSIKIVFIIATLIIIVLGFGVIFQIPIIQDFILNFYSASYEGLVPRMIFSLKPIATFGTHSISGLFLFLFFYLNYLSFRILSKKVYLINAVLLLLILVFIRSNTAYFYIVIAFFVILPSLRKMKLKVVLIISLSICVFALFVVQFLDLTLLSQAFNIAKTLTSKSNGLIGRYSEESPIAPTINYILENPFSPIGLSYSEKLYYTDAGFILYFLRGSLMLLITVYLGFYRFIYSNLNNKTTSYFLLFVIFIFEVGYPILINFRMLSFILFVIVYLNFLEKKKDVYEG